MKKMLMYNSGEMFPHSQTGGAKRFEELTRYLFREELADLCCQDNLEVMQQKGLKCTYHFREGSKNGLCRILPPEARRLVANWGLLHQIKKKNYENIIAFDVPPAVGLCLAGFRNVVLMIRKDLIGYDQVTSGMNVSGLHRLKVFYMWLSEAICLKCVKMIVVQCEYDKKQLLERHKWLAPQVGQKFRVQINNVNPSWIVKKSEASIPKERPTNQFRVCFVGNFNDNRKGHDILLKAAQIVHNNGCDIRFEIIGSGRDFELYREQYESKNVIFHGRMDNPMEMLKACDLMVVPSRADSCPNTVMESLYNGVAVIGSNVGGIPEILLDKESMFQLDAENLAMRIESLYHNSDQIEALKNRQAGRKGELMFDWAERITQIICE